MKTTAAVLAEPGRPLELADLEIPALKPGQVLIEVAYSGVCHTQLLEARGHRGPDRFLPHCLGHEGSGVVREVGDGVTRVKRGDAVVLSWIKGEGADAASTRYTWDGRAVNAGAITTFATHSVISENRLTAIPAGLSMRHAALVGCAVPTGAGAVFNTAAARTGDSLVVFGVGGVGACAIAAAAACGCRPIVAVDVKPDKLALARQLGATHAIDSGELDPVEAIGALCPGGADYAIEATGQPCAMRQALAAVKPRGGAAVIVGNARQGQMLEIDPAELNRGKRLLGTWGGESIPDRDYPRYGHLIATGKLNIEPLVGPTYGLLDVNAALDELERGTCGRPLLDIGGVAKSVSRSAA